MEPSATPTKSKDEKPAQIGHFRLAAIPAFLSTLGQRIFKRDKHHREGDQVQVKAIPDAVKASDLKGPRPVQLTQDGTGSLFYRHYGTQFYLPNSSAEKIMCAIQADPNQFSPQELAVFRKTRGPMGRLQEGDEFLVEITGPWNGPVRVIKVSPTHFSLATLQGHMEAGEIRFEVTPLGADQYRFDIYSWARSKDDAVDLAYDTLKVAKQAQTEMWTIYCENVVKKNQGVPESDVLVETKKTPYQSEVIPVQQTPGRWQEYQAQLKALEGLRLNFDAQKQETYTQPNGWNVDKWSCDLTAEKPGPAEDHGPFALAKEILKNYEFPDPKLITGIFSPDGPLDSRTMLLRAKFLGINFFFGVKIGKVTDEMRATPQGEAQIWGYNYRTLEGHFERGEINFEIWKWTQSGKVEFKISAFSKADRIRNPFYRLGFRMFGRSLQIRFARSSMERMQRLVQERLAETTAG